MQLNEPEREEIFSVVDDVLKNKSKDRESIIPILQRIQARLGYLPGPAM